MSAQLEDIMRRADGLLAGLKPGTVIADCTTAQPQSTEALVAAAVTSEALAVAQKAGVDLKALHEVVPAGGANSVMFQRLVSYHIDGDQTQLQFAMTNAQKDLRYYLQLAEGEAMPSLVAGAAHQLYSLVIAMGYGERHAPTMLDALMSLGNKSV